MLLAVVPQHLLAPFLSREKSSQSSKVCKRLQEVGGGQGPTP